MDSLVCLYVEQALSVSGIVHASSVIGYDATAIGQSEGGKEGGREGRECYDVGAHDNHAM